MTTREIIYSFFYGLGFVGAMVSGLTLGFTNSHIPALAMLIALLFTAIGLICFVIDLFLKKSKQVHVIGLLANLAVVAYTYLISMA